MRIGVPRETKDGERRVGVTPAGTRQLVDDGHTMIVAPNAGAAVGFADADYRAAGATIAASLDAVWSCELIVKVKELQPHEYAHRRRDDGVRFCAAQPRPMRPGSAIVDVGIDQGGIAETSRMTKLSDPTYVECGVVHYAVPNMPALVARTATLALTQATVRDGDIVHPGLAADAARHHNRA